MVAHPLGKRTVLNRPCAFEPRLLRQSLDRWQSLLYCTRLESVRACGHRRLESYPIRQFGELAERSKAPVLKTGVPSGTGGSNPPTLLHVVGCTRRVDGHQPVKLALLEHGEFEPLTPHHFSSISSKDALSVFQIGTLCTPFVGHRTLKHSM